MTILRPDAAARREIGREVWRCLVLGTPLILTNAIEMAMVVTNTAVAGRLGPEALAASSVALALYNLPLLFGIGLTAAVAPLVAQARGQDADATAAIRRTVHHGFAAVLIFLLPTWLMLWRSRDLLVAWGEAPDLAAAAAAYLHALQWTLLPAMLYFVLRSAFAALERPRSAVLVGLLGVVLNAGLNLVLTKGWGPVPALGLFGSGLSTLAANMAMAGAMLAIAARGRPFRPLRLLDGVLAPAWTGFGAFWRLGLPIAVAILLEVGMFSVATVLVAHIDVPSLAAHAIALQVASVTFMVPLGIAQAATVRIGRAFGAGDRRAVTRAGWTALAIGLSAMTLSAAVLVLLPRLILGLFFPPDEPGGAAVAEVGVTLLALAGLFQLADGGQVVLAGMLRGLQDTRGPMVIAAVGYWGVGLPLGAALCFGLGLRAPGIWLGLTAGLFAAAALLLARWLAELRRLSAAEP